jgi:MFS family permease
MFFTGLLSSFLGLFVFTRLQESPMWTALHQARGAPASTQPAEARAGLRAFLPSVRLGILLTTAGGGLSYLTSGYLPTFMKLVNHVEPTALGLILSVSALAVIASSVSSGLLTDLIGRKRAMWIYGGVSLVAIPLLYRGLAAATDLEAIGLYSVLLSGVGTFCYAPLLIVLNERFPTEIRSTGTAVSWNIGFAIGGSMPTIVSLFTNEARALPKTLAAACALCSLVYLTIVMLTPETKGAMR